MFRDVDANDLKGVHTSVRLAHVPDVCPRCQRSIQPIYLWSGILRERDMVQTVFRCPHQACQEAYIATYKNGHRNESSHPVYDFVHSAPVAPHEATFSEVVNDVSPSFVDIYNQSIAAESHDLDQLVGIGLRKSLEFLIKDFACLQHTGKEEEIRLALLSACISKYINDVNVKECAKRAAWLGNDETHYTRRWDDRDISDLKLLVRLTVNWIENVMLTQKYMVEMADGRA